MTPDDINQITGDDVMYWLGNEFMSPELLAGKVCYWADAIVAARLGRVDAAIDELGALRLADAEKRVALQAEVATLREQVRNLHEVCDREQAEVRRLRELVERAERNWEIEKGLRIQAEKNEDWLNGNVERLQVENARLTADGAE